jgi:hypothetical protein
MEFDNRNGEIVLKYCPVCPKPHNHETSNLHTMNIKATNGLWNCFRCGQNGNWFEFKKRILYPDMTNMENLISPLTPETP